MPWIIFLSAGTMVASTRLFGQYIYGKLFDTEPFPTPRAEEVALPGFVLRLWEMLRSRFVRKSSRR